MLDLRRLVVLRAVVEAGSVTAAATSLGYTPSAVSQNIAALERETKISLFEKAGRGIRPTQAGRLLAEHARAVMERLRDAEEALEALRAGEAGRLRVAAFASGGSALVPWALARFRKEHPRVEIGFVMAESDEAVAQLRSGQIDVAVITEHDAIDATGNALHYSHLFDDPYCLVLPSSHPSANRRAITLADMANESWIATASARCNCLQTVTSACARAGFTPRFDIEADEFATTVGFVAAGLGIAMVPMLALSSVPDGVRVRPLSGDPPSRHVYAVTKSTRFSEVAISALLDAFRFSAGSYLNAVA